MSQTNVQIQEGCAPVTIDGVPRVLIVLRVTHGAQRTMLVHARSLTKVSTGCSEDTCTAKFNLVVGRKPELVCAPDDLATTLEKVLPQLPFSRPQLLFSRP